jgi:glucose-6-phosphate dehydrogenase assembly protein OpcA
MTIDLTSTTTGAIRDALTRERNRLGGQTTGMVLNLIIVTDEAGQYDAVRAASEAGREHPCRILGVITRRPDADSRLDAEIHTGEAGPSQTVLLRMYGPLGQHADSVIRPLLAADTPVVTWWPGGGPASPSRDPLGVLAQRRVTDAAEATSPREALAARSRGYQQGDTDLSWTRATSWRSLLAATMDQPHGAISGGLVTAEKDNPTADLIAAWLTSRLGAPFGRDNSGGPGITEVRFTTADGDIVLARPDGRTATLTKPGEPDRRVALHRRESAELLTEELRRLNPDEVYGETLAGLAASAGGDQAEVDQAGSDQAEVDQASSDQAGGQHRDPP